MHPGQEFTLTEIRDEVFRGSIPAPRLRDAIELLIDLGEFTLVKRDTGGRPAEAVRRLTSEEIMGVLENGRPPKMIDPRMTALDCDQTMAFLVWLGGRRESLLAATADAEPLAIQWSQTPWWEFR